jgi:hypothetical protein
VLPLLDGGGIPLNILFYFLGPSILPSVYPKLDKRLKMKNKYLTYCLVILIQINLQFEDGLQPVILGHRYLHEGYLLYFGFENHPHLLEYVVKY